MIKVGISIPNLWDFVLENRQNKQYVQILAGKRLRAKEKCRNPN